MRNVTQFTYMPYLSPSSRLLKVPLAELKVFDRVWLNLYKLKCYGICCRLHGFVSIRISYKYLIFNGTASPE